MSLALTQSVLALGAGVGRRGSSAAPIRSIDQGCGHLPAASVSFDVALFLPFWCNKRRQSPANAGTKRKSEIIQFCRAPRSIAQRAANSRKARLTPFIPAVNRRVAGSNPA